MNEALWKKAHERLHELYGEVPALECWGRLESEQSVLKETNVILSFDLLGKMMAKAKEQSGTITARGLVGSSFSAWLLGATEVNPLPPHYYCPVCKHIEFHREVEDGWDLPPQKCACGAKMIRDGHDIPFEGYASFLQKGESVEINVDPDFMPVASELLKQQYEELAGIVPVETMSDPIGFREALPVKKFVLFQRGETIPTLDRDGVLRVSAQSYYNEYRKNIQYTFICSPVIQALREMAKQTNIVPEETELLSSDVLDAVSKKQCEALPGIMEALEKKRDALTFSLLSRLEGLRCGSDIWENNGDEFVECGTANVRELIAFREDVWQMILSCIANGGSAGFGLPLKIMDDVRLGRYSARGMAQDVEQILLRMGVPEWYIAHMKKVVYAFPKAHCISLIEDKLKLAWYQMNKPDVYADVMKRRVQDEETPK